MAKKASKSGLFSLTQLAAKLHVNRSTLSRKLSGLKHVSGPKGARLYPLSEVAALLDEERDPELLEARRRKLAAEAGLAELKLKRERGEVVDYRETLGSLLEVFRHFHTRFTVTAPQRLGPRLRAAKTAREAEEVLRAELEREFQEFRGECTQYLAGLDEAEGLKQEEADDEEA